MKAFISYSWDSEDHKAWVRRFADELIRNGVEVTLDQYDLRIGEDRFKFMESSVRMADVVLCVCTPDYVQRANEREKGVGVETTLITPQFFEENKGKQFIPIVRESRKGVTATPSYMAALIYVDFQDDAEFPSRMEELLRHLHQQPKYKKPPTGSAPTFSSPASSTATGSPLGTPSVDQILSQIRGSRVSDWNYFDERGLFVLKSNPDVTVHRQDYDPSVDTFQEDWSASFPDPVAYRAIHEVKYRNNVVHEEYLISVDGHRMYIPMPRSPMELEITQEQYEFGRFANSFNPWGNRYDEYLQRAGIEVV